MLMYKIRRNGWDIVDIPNSVRYWRYFLPFQLLQGFVHQSTVWNLAGSWLSTYQSTYVSTYIFIYLYLSTSTPLSLSLSIYLSIYLAIYRTWWLVGILYMTKVMIMVLTLSGRRWRYILKKSYIFHPAKCHWKKMSVLESIYFEICIHDMMSMCWNVHPTVNPKIFYIKKHAVSEKKT